MAMVSSKTEAAIESKYNWLWTTGKEAGDNLRLTIHPYNYWASFYMLSYMYL